MDYGCLLELVESLYVEVHEPALEIRRIKLDMQYATKLKPNPTLPSYHCALVLCM